MIPKFDSKYERNTFYINALIGFAAFSLLAYLFIPILSSDRVEHFVFKAGIFGPLVIMSYFIISDVIAPIAGSPGVVLSVALYGLFKGLLIAYLAGIISATINFYISKRFGRSLVQKFVGKHAMKQIDQYAEKFGVRVLVIGRIFGFPFFEIISYAAGLTTMLYKQYMLITVIFSIIPAFTIKALMHYANMSSPASVLLWTLILSVIGIVCSYISFKLIDIVNKKTVDKVV
jgi:uncharacterized membrane protein YdjX (TVP38/TMEM64 family)